LDQTGLGGEAREQEGGSSNNVIRFRIDLRLPSELKLLFSMSTSLGIDSSDYLSPKNANPLTYLKVNL
jgi:hypothetical protein